MKISMKKNTDKKVYKLFHKAIFRGAILRRVLFPEEFFLETIWYMKLNSDIIANYLEVMEKVYVLKNKYW